MKIIKRMSNGETLRSICRREDMPSYEAVYNWQEKLAEFRDALARARTLGTHNIADECIEIADRKRGDPQKLKLMIDTRLRLIAVWNRKDYAPKNELDTAGRITLGELIEASYKRIEEGRAPQITDITPRIEAPHTDNPHTDDQSTDKLIARTGDNEMVRTQSGEVVVRRARRAAS